MPGGKMQNQSAVPSYHSQLLYLLPIEVYGTTLVQGGRLEALAAVLEESRDLKLTADLQTVHFESVFAHQWHSP
jgi:hypothetical protein